MHNAHLFGGGGGGEKVQPTKTQKTTSKQTKKKNNKKLATRGKEQVTDYQNMISAVSFPFSQNATRHSHSIQNPIKFKFHLKLGQIMKY